MGPNRKISEDTFMSDYTPEMVAAIQTASPLTFEKAQEIASSDAFVRAGKGHRSVIAKAKSLGVDYIPKAKPAKASKDNGPTKAETLAAIRSALSLADREGDLTKSELVAVLENIG
jgi:hypothetical protein